MGAPVTKIEYDGKFTVSYELADGTASAFRCTPEIGRLIAAAPALLEALSRIVDIYAWDDRGFEVEEARAAIRAATGSP